MQKMSLREARAFLVKHDKAAAMAAGRWHRIARRWAEAVAVVEADKAAFRWMPPADTRKPVVMTDDTKRKLSKRMREVSAPKIKPGKKRKQPKSIWN